MLGLFCFPCVAVGSFNGGEWRGGFGDLDRQAASPLISTSEGGQGLRALLRALPYLSGVFSVKSRALFLALMASAGLVCALTVQPTFSQTSFPEQFVTPQYLSGVGYGASGILIGVGDLNGDGRPDILRAQC